LKDKRCKKNKNSFYFLISQFNDYLCTPQERKRGVERGVAGRSSLGRGIRREDS
jgi:hypothetical protein